jgi:hypothetical protein
MPIFKEVFQFTQPDKGFTEVYYSSAPDIRTAGMFGQPFLNAALAFRANLTVLRKIRISDVANNRNTLVKVINQQNGTVTGTADICGASAVVACNAPSTGARRNIWLRGLPDNSVVRNGETGTDNPSPGLREGIQNWMIALEESNYQIRSLMKLGVAPYVYKSITAVTVTERGYVTIVTSPTWATTPSGRVILSQIDEKLFPGLNGQYAASPAALPGQFTVPYNSHLAQGTYSLNKGRTRPADYEYGTIISVQSGFDHFSTRDTGRNPLGGRGRRLAKIKRSA